MTDPVAAVNAASCRSPPPSFHVSLINMDSEVAERRPYRMVARAESAAATAERILDAAVEVFWELPGDRSRSTRWRGGRG